MIEIVYQPDPVTWAKDRQRTALHLKRAGTNAAYFMLVANLTGLPPLRMELPALDNGNGEQEAIFYPAYLLDRRLSYQLPDPATWKAPETMKQITFTATVHLADGTPFDTLNITLGVVKGSLPFLHDRTIHHPSLTEFPRERTVTLRQEGYLYRYQQTAGTANVQVEYRCRFGSDTVQSHYLTIPSVPYMTVYTVPLRYLEAGYPTLVTGGRLEAVDIYISGSLVLSLSFEEEGPLDRYYHFFNPRGGLDTLRSTSIREEKRKFERQSSGRYPHYGWPVEQHQQVDTLFRQAATFRQYVGFMEREHYRAALAILHSERGWVDEDGQWLPIRITTVETGVERDEHHLYALEFEYQYAYTEYGHYH